MGYVAKCGNSGVKTFIVNQLRRVYEKNLGLNTAEEKSITPYNPDARWKLVQEVGDILSGKIPERVVKN